jgi:branched-chain amino acid transport system permease protein
MKRILLVLALLIAFPIAMVGMENLFYVSFASRVMIYAIAATSLNLVLGYGGMLSFGHAAFVGAGAYVASIFVAEGVTSAWIGWPAAVAASALLAWIIGAISLRTRGVYFIMITLAFAEVVFYYVVLFFLLAALYALHRVVHSRFGRVLIAIRENQARVEALGLPVYRHQLLCFVIAGAAGGLAGALLASHGKYVNPNVLHWVQSGTLMIMVILGGVGHLWGGVIGAALLLCLEHVIADYPLPWLAQIAPNYQQHASLGVGIVLLAIVLFAPQGIAGLISRKKHA